MNESSKKKEGPARARTTHGGPPGRDRELWRSLEEWADDGTFRAFVEREAPRLAGALSAGVGRRDFMKWMAASLALAGLGACTSEPEEKIVPYVRQPEQFVPGQPLYYATALMLGGYARGVLVESHMGRPTKIEGNVRHPASLGATDALAQASVLTLYDPDRAQVVSYGARINTWNDFLENLAPRLEAQRVAKGAGFRVLTPAVTSPTLGRQLARLLERFPEARWHQYEPLMRDNVREGARLAFGETVEPIYDFSAADVVLSLDADFLFAMPGSVRYTHDFVGRRRVRRSAQSMNRLYAVEGTPSLTGAMADHRLPIPSQSIGAFALALAGLLGIGPREAASQNDAWRTTTWIDALARDLESHRGSSLVVAGEQQPPLVHALAHAMNEALGNAGRTVTCIDPPEVEAAHQVRSITSLVEDMANGRVELLLILGGNPVYDAPADLEFGKHLTKVELRVHSSLFKDETASLCQWHIPATHDLESWSDAKAFDGTTTIVQPLIAPLYNGKSPHEIVAAFLGEGSRSGYEIVRAHWSEQVSGDFESFWHEALHNGIVEDRPAARRDVALEPPSRWLDARALAREPGLYVAFTRDPYVYDGRFSNNAWLQELPKPLTKIVWDNAALMSPATAKRLGVASEDVVELAYEGRTVEAPVWVMPGHADELVTLPLGYGRKGGGRVGQNVGFDAYALRTSGALWFGAGLEVRKTGRRYALAPTEKHHAMEGRPIALSGTLEEFRRNPDFVHERVHAPHESLYPGFEHEGYAWGMSIDLNACIGCNACVTACQSENNIPVVGKEQVIAGREMHWLRVDRYYQGTPENPQTIHQPVPCMHCENAPCEVVCPVGATVHSVEGLNDMVYNRCVGTRYCSNNCPYKVRRFNFYQYSDFDTPSLKPMRNPDVTVRSVGVMEKCTYCVQRISQARITADRENRRIDDGEIETACQQVCPAEAIVFGDINDRDSEVARLKREPLDYSLLAELNTRPRTTYLARLRNPNPEIG